MTTASAISGNRANLFAADVSGNRRRALRLNSDVMQKSRDIFPVKTAQHLAEITGYSLRSCEYWLSGKVVIPSDALCALLHSEQGREFLSVVMLDHTPRWWLKLKARLKRIDFDVAARQQQRAYLEMLDEEARAAARPVGDADFYEGQPSPSRTLAPRRRR